MRNLAITAFVAAFLLLSFSSQAQLMGVKSFDYSILENKVLYIPKYSENSNFAQKLIKKGKFDKLENLQAKQAAYNTLWEDAMAQSSWDISPYEVREIDYRALVKSKDDKALLLRYYRDDYGNWSAQIFACAPKRTVIATTIINGLDLGDVNDVRLMMNMLNYSLNTSLEVEEEGDKTSNRNVRNKYKENFVAFFDGISEKTFLVPASTHKKEKKRVERDADLKEALKLWKMSSTEFTTEEDIEKRRLEGDTESFYWRNFNYYTSSPLIVYHINFIITCDRDEVAFMFVGKKRLKPATLTQIQEKMTKKAERYRKQLAK